MFRKLLRFHIEMYHKKRDIGELSFISELLTIFSVQSVKITVISVSHLHCRYGMWHALVYQLARQSKLFLQDILLGGNIHFFLKQMAKGGF